jgi:hypothetical protein
MNVIMNKYRSGPERRAQVVHLVLVFVSDW